MEHIVDRGTVTDPVTGRSKNYSYTVFFKPENRDVVLEIDKFKKSRGPGEGLPAVVHILAGLAYGFPINEVYNFVKSDERRRETRQGLPG